MAGDGEIAGGFAVEVPVGSAQVGSVAGRIEQQVHAAARVAVVIARVELGSTTRPIEQVALHYYEVEQDAKFDMLQKMLQQEQGSFLVFARTKHGADKLATKLGKAGVKSSAIHGDRSQSQRSQALKGFQAGYYRVLVATDVAARGIHVDNIAHVVNYDLPQAPEDFIHRVGRTGRMGSAGRASTLVCGAEIAELRSIERALKLKIVRKQVNSEQRIPARTLRNTLPSRTLSRMPGEVFS